jgi:hypothetical protein
MTEYEKLVKEGKMAPMNGLDGLFIGSLVEGIVKGTDTMDEGALEAIEGVMIEIEYLFRDDQETLEKLNIIIEEYKEKQTNE